LILRGNLTAYKISEEGFRVKERQRIDLSKENLSCGSVALAHCMLGDFQKAAAAIIKSCSAGIRNHMHVYHTANTINLAVALWEVDNYTKRGVALNGLDLAAFEKAREILKFRSNKLAKLHALGKPTSFQGSQSIERLKSWNWTCLLLNKPRL